MDANTASDVIMNDDSDMSDFNESSEAEDMDASSDSDVDSDPPASSTTGVPGPSQLRALRRSYVWQTANNPPQPTTFIGTQGPTRDVDILSDSPYDYFKLIFDDSFIDIIVRETNRYASQYIANAVLSPRARAKSWQTVTRKEMEVFLGLVLLTGLIDKKGRLSSYWSKNPIISTPFFSETMPRDRFQLIMTFLHFNDNEAMPSPCNDKLYKIRPIFEYLSGKWRTLYSLGEYIAIDEGMLKWRGRLSFRVYNKDKPTKYGIKAYILADSTSGYCYNMDIYHRERKTIKETVQGLLTSKCTGLWHSLYMDNFYNSVELSEALLEQNIHTVGTLRSNRGEPPEIRNPSTMARHDVVAKNNGKVTVLAWKDKRVVKAISTKHDGSLCTISRRKKGGHGEMETVEKPVCICEYNQYMSGVDHVDQMISYYPCTRKTLKWTKKVFFYLLEVSVHNCHVIYKTHSGNTTMKLYDFQMKLVSSLCQISGQSDDIADSSEDEAPPEKTPRYDPETRLRGGFKAHHMSLYPATEKQKYPQRRCRVCMKKKVRKETRVYCKECNIPLCKTPCFGDYHTKKR